MSGSTVRLAMAAAGTLVLSLLSTPVAEAGSARRHSADSGRTVCGAPSAAQSTPRSQVRSFSRKGFFRTRQVVHRHIMAKLQRHEVKRPLDDDDAINPAVSGHDTPVLLGALEPIGMLTVPPCQPASHRTVSRRSPRGPPWSPALL
jgi:hypothetical protein